MYAIPYQVKPDEFNLFIVIDDENIRRIKEYDPADIRLKNGLPEPWKSMKLNAIQIGYATDRELMDIVADRDKNVPIKDVLTKLSRGWKVEPGDKGGPWEIPKTK